MCPLSWRLSTTLLVLFCHPGAGTPAGPTPDPAVDSSAVTAGNRWPGSLYPGPAEQDFEVFMNPENLALEPGGSLVINCSTSCAQPQDGGLETSLNKTLLDEQPGWIQYSVSNASEDTVVICYFICSGQQNFKSARVHVFSPPEQVLLTLQPPRVAVGSSFTLECRVPAVAPLENLTLTLFRGAETLLSQTFREATRAPQEAVVTHNCTAPQEDGPHNFSCLAQLDLGWGPLNSLTDFQMLEVYGEGPPQEEAPPDVNWKVIFPILLLVLVVLVTPVIVALWLHRQSRRGMYILEPPWCCSPCA